MIAIAILKAIRESAHAAGGRPKEIVLRPELLKALYIEIGAHHLFGIQAGTETFDGIPIRESLTGAPAWLTSATGDTVVIRMEGAR